MITPAFMFTIFMLTLGPIKTVPAFFALTRGQTPAAMRALALKGTTVATAVCCLIALVMTGVAASWRISSDDLRFAGGVLLFVAAREMIGQVGGPVSPAVSPATSAVISEQSAVTPLAIPVIVTPWGAVAILFFADLAYGDLKMMADVIGILVLIMTLNLVGMLLARQIIACVGMTSFLVLGWIFAVLQAGLAVDAIVTSLRNLAPFQSFR
jgi:multiple antibiotic resistance protein